MGLDTSHDCWHGSYSSFAIWRTEISRALGWPTWGEGRYSFPEDSPRTEDVLYGWWGFGKTPEEPLHVLLLHSDCDGYIFPWNADPLADRLLDLLEEKRIPDEWQEITKQFAVGLQRAAYECEVVEFR
jgi:hypothetical protein